jgi:creatinine amidohydrolase
VSDVRHWDALTRAELNELADQALLVLPTGTTEQHGPHLATGTDSVIAGAVAEQAAAQATRPEVIVIAPTLSFGASDHHLPFGGTLSLRAETFQAVLADLLASAAKAGFKRVFVLNAHGGNTAACAVAVGEAARRHGIVCATALVSELVDPAQLEAPARGHAGIFETSVMLALDRSKVRPNLAGPSPGGEARQRPRGLVVGEPGRWEELDGFTDRPQEASVEFGERAFAACVAAAAKAFAEVAAIGD